MFDWIKNIFRNDKTDNINSDVDNTPIDEQTKFIWCLVGNVVDEHLFGKDREIVYGTKHFPPNTKVYCFPAQWGDGYENIKVIGRHRKTSRKVSMIMPTKFITNWRLQKVYSPYILNLMHSQHGWTNSNKDKETILEMLTWLPEKTIKSK